MSATQHSNLCPHEQKGVKIRNLMVIWVSQGREMQILQVRLIPGCTGSAWQGGMEPAASETQISSLLPQQRSSSRTGPEVISSCS